MISFLTPGAGVFFLLMIPVFLFHLLKVRLKRQPVSTMIFWRDVFEEKRHRKLWRRLRHGLSLLISLLLTSLLAFALMNPVLSKKEARPMVILLDRSASMGAINPVTGKSRLDEAKLILLSMIPADQTEAEMAVVDFGSTPEIKLGFTRHGKTLRRTIETVDVTNEPTALAEGIDFARKLTVGRTDAKILAVTDGGDPRLPDLLNASPNVTFIPVGALSNNVGITRFQPRRSLTDATGYEILVQLENFGAESVDCRLEIDLDDSPVDVVPITLTPNKPETRIIRSVSETGGTLRGRLNLEGCSSDVDTLSSDNEAFGILPAKPLQKILFYGTPDFFLSHVFASQQQVTIKSVAEIPDAVPDESVLVIHGEVPARIPTGNVLFINPTGTSDLFRTKEALNAPLIATQKEDSPILRFVHLTNIAIPGAKKIDVINNETSNAPSLAHNAPVVLSETPEGDPVLLLWNEPNRKAVLLSADPSQGDLALRTAFPILIANTLSWFRGEGGEMTKSTANAPLHSESEGNLRLAGSEFYKTFNRGLPAEFRPRRPVWFWITTAVFLLMTAEWFLYQRRWID